MVMSPRAAVGHVDAMVAHFEHAIAPTAASRAGSQSAAPALPQLPHAFDTRTGVIERHPKPRPTCDSARRFQAYPRSSKNL
jgi:hypothetical protein